jgi:organic hydroperoxide reductase OsmC/OhrA
MAHAYKATVSWRRGGATFTDRQYSRGHVWRFDGGVEVPASASPQAVKLPLSRADAVDPEEALVASVSSCHMLFFLDFASRAGFVVDRYEDEAVGEMSKNERGRLFMSKVTLNPSITFSGAKQPSAADLDGLHHRSHDECYIANSVRAEIVVAPTRVSAA